MVRLGSTCVSSGIGLAYLAPSPATIRPRPLSYQQECSINLPVFGSVLRARCELERPFWTDVRDQPEAFAIERHIRRKRPLPAEIVSMRSSPGGKRAVALAFLESEGRVDLIEAALRQLDRLDHRYRDTGAAQNYPSLADMCFRPLARCPARRPFFAGQHQPGEFIGQFGTIAEREPFERPPIRILVFGHCRRLR